MADTQLLLQAARAAVEEHQTGKLSPSVEDILHLEKRWNKLPGSSTGSASLEDATALLGTEVLEGEPLEFVVQQVFSGKAPPQVLTKRQFLSLAHVAEVAQGKAFDLLTAEDAQRAQALPASHKKRPPTIRDAHIEDWQIAASAGAATGEAQEAEQAAEYEAAAAVLAANAPGPLEGHLSRATSLQLPDGPLQQGMRALSRQNSADNLAAAAQLARQQHQSGATSYQSLEDCAAEAVVEEAAGEAGLDDGAVDEFTTKLNGLMKKMSGDVAQLQTPEGVRTADDSAAAEAPVGAGDEAPASGKTRSSWESFNSTPGTRAAAAAAKQQQDALAATTPPQQQQSQQSVNEAVVAAAMAAGMTFMQHLQAAGAAGAAQASPFSDINPLRHAAAVAAAAAAASTSPGPSTAYTPASPDVQPAGAHAQVPRQVIAEMMAHLNLRDASPAQLQAAAATLQQQALAIQQQNQHPASSQQGSLGSAASGDQQQQRQQGAHSEGSRRSWRAFDANDPQRQQEGSRMARRQRAAAAVPVSDLPPPQPAGIAGWEPMTADDLHRCQTIFTKKGYPEVGGMEKHSAMEYFAKLRMEPHIFHAAWQAADLGVDGRLDCREFCVFVQLLRGAQKGRTVPSRLTAEEAAALLGEAPMPAAAPSSSLAPLHIDSARLRSALGHSRQASLAGHDAAESVLQGLEDDDDASSVDSGIAESVSGMSVCSRPSYRPAPGTHPSLAPAMQHHSRTGLGSVLGGGAPTYHPAVARSERLAAYPAGSSAAAHSLLEVAVQSAVVKYRKALSTPIFTISVRDSLGRLVELPIDTHPGHYRRETNTIHSSAIVKLTTQLQRIPPGSSLYVEIKHWKSDKKRFSTLAWACAPLEKIVDFGPTAARVRSGPVDLPLFKKPLDLTMRRVKRLSNRSPADLHLTVRGIE